MSHISIRTLGPHHLIISLYIYIYNAHSVYRYTYTDILGTKQIRPDDSKLSELINLYGHLHKFQFPTKFSNQEDIARGVVLRRCVYIYLYIYIYIVCEYYIYILWPTRCRHRPHLSHRRARPTTRLTQGRRTLAHTFIILLYIHIRTSVYIFFTLLLSY